MFDELIAKHPDWLQHDPVIRAVCELRRRGLPDEDAVTLLVEMLKRQLDETTVEYIEHVMRCGDSHHIRIVASRAEH